MSKHLAVLNLFEQPDGTLEITVAGSGSSIPNAVPGDAGQKPIDQIENRIISAATRMHQSKRNDGTYREIPL